MSPLFFLRSSIFVASWAHGKPNGSFRSITTSHNAISSGGKPLKRLRRPSRGGQNLSERYKRLENSLRGKDALSRDLQDFSTTTTPAPAPALGSKAAQTFYGFQVPQEPKPPADDECCMSGCAVCVYDLFEEAVEEFQGAVSLLRASLEALKVPQSEWPAHIRTKSVNASSPPSPLQRRETVISAFEEMERTLALKKQERETEAKR
ncbi:hypothetical protein CPB83DRAFT_892707 [Crepidotus variabilis]|uniref:Oxidoreductase-like domain-containing protein n=1 Tax=Crepidotus variabilis TaxID=179855 RepID=A0A9P6EIQ9_9AGAR|nr:hypothetical protein CPB83DRAFT_892707 [Crepidotus variabilis]